MSLVRTEIVDGIAQVTIDVTPLPLLNVELFIELFGLLDRLEGEADLRVAVFRSANPDFFLMHADAQALLQMQPSTERPAEPNGGVALFERLRRLSCATIGVLDGAARGGACELLYAMDMRIGSTRAVVGQPEVALGLLPGGGGTVRWAKALGRARALELLLTGRDMDAEEALAVGWLQAVVPPHGLDDEADRLARRIARMPAASITEIKRVVDVALGPIEDAILAETQALARLMAAGQHVEPIRRFLAAGGQTRGPEVDDFQKIVDETTST
ncbi:MAG: enoyl-CoA hydratase/isomerase family protein [Candidatus Binatia bacterium]|nr:enoyl-CoA hydratase/isomerase family protein [Candidatus Binatia bacterium]